ncbi:hypothetical protein K0U00_45850 [Paenibacillus sepulcri]|uniref:Uncharacterized protein n=1 Tax=Paenibacillus sepulcri TaxID=359917 RepID=A0ABS7CKC7_9BACL|nr:hypothetical protein [Paenibacillus sepulcri]
MLQLPGEETAAPSKDGNSRFFLESKKVEDSFYFAYISRKETCCYVKRTASKFLFVLSRLNKRLKEAACRRSLAQQLDVVLMPAGQT